MMVCKGFWTKENCLEESKKYKDFKELKKNNNFVYTKCLKNGWLFDFYPNYSNHRINKNDCIKEAIKYKTKKDLKKNNPRVYSKIIRNDWLDDVCSHMEETNGYWTKDRCNMESLQYKNITSFKKNSYKAYKYSLINDWLDDICSHMDKIGNLYKRCIYAFEFSDNYVYVGLTYNLDERMKSHFKRLNSQVNKHYKKTKINPTILKLTDYIDVGEAILKEGEYISLYKDNGWNILNVQKAGNLGGTSKITEKICKDIINNYRSFTSFRKENPSIYKFIKRNELLYLLDVLDRSQRKKDGYWTKDECKKVALLYNSRIEFFRKDSSVYNKCQKNGWLDELCIHMNTNQKKPKNFWTKEKVLLESKKYKTKEEFKKGSPSAYTICVKNKWLDEVDLITRKEWTKDECIDLCRGCSSKKEIRSKNEVVYRIIIGNRWNIQSEIGWISFK